MQFKELRRPKHQAGSFESGCVCPNVREIIRKHYLDYPFMIKCWHEGRCPWSNPIWDCIQEDFCRYFAQ